MRVVHRWRLYLVDFKALSYDTPCTIYEIDIGEGNRRLAGGCVPLLLSKLSIVFCSRCR